jgi:hypothetical protein
MFGNKGKAPYICFNNNNKINNNKKSNIMKNIITENVLKLYKSELTSSIENGYIKDLKIEIVEPLKDDFHAEFYMNTANEMIFSLERPIKIKVSMVFLGEYWEEEKSLYDGLPIMIGYTTKSGYYSRKKVDVSFEYRPAKNDKYPITKNQAFELAQFINYDAKEDTFDPFWHENNQKSKEASALVWLSKKITDSRWG